MGQPNRFSPLAVVETPTTEDYNEEQALVSTIIQNVIAYNNSDEPIIHTPKKHPQKLKAAEANKSDNNAAKKKHRKLCKKGEKTITVVTQVVLHQSDDNRGDPVETKTEGEFAVVDHSDDTNFLQMHANHNNNNNIHNNKQ